MHEESIAKPTKYVKQFLCPTAHPANLANPWISKLVLLCYFYINRKHMDNCPSAENKVTLTELTIPLHILFEVNTQSKNWLMLI